MPTISTEIIERCFKYAQRSGIDGYKLIAVNLLRIPYDDVTEDQREAAKQISLPYVTLMGGYDAIIKE